MLRSWYDPVRRAEERFAYLARHLTADAEARLRAFDARQQRIMAALSRATVRGLLDELGGTPSPRRVRRPSVTL